LRILEIVRKNSISHSVDREFWKRIWTCKTWALNDDDNDDSSVCLFVFVVVGLFGTAAMKAYCTLTP
jgi:hypothetical protein